MHDGDTTVPGSLSSTSAHHERESPVIDTCPVLVLDANQRSALAVTRSLGRHGIEVHTADDSDTSLAGASRFSVGYMRYPGLSGSESTQVVDEIAAYCRQHGIGMIMPMTEQTSQLLLQHRESLGDVLLPLADAETIDRLADKCRLFELADELEIPAPRSQTVQPGTDTDLESHQYPLVLKPGKSWVQTDQGWCHTAVRFADDADSAADLIAHDLSFRHHAFMLQQKVPGTGCGVFAIYDRGKPLAFFAHRRLHEKPPRGGVSVISQSAGIDPELLEHSRRLLDAVNWHGVAMVEFRADEEQAWLMEVNTRFWGSLQLAIDAGVDFPWLLYQVTLNEAPPPIDSYREGKRLRWLLGDLDWLYLTLKDEGFSFSRKCRAVLSFLVWAPISCKHEVNRLSDMGPFWHECREYWRALRR